MNFKVKKNYYKKYILIFKEENTRKGQENVEEGRGGG